MIITSFFIFLPENFPQIQNKLYFYNRNIKTRKNMIFKFTILSDEAEDFIRIIEIDSEATFFDLHNAILDSAGYEKIR